MNTRIRVTIVIMMALLLAACSAPTAPLGSAGGSQPPVALPQIQDQSAGQQQGQPPVDQQSPQVVNNPAAQPTPLPTEEHVHDATHTHATVDLHNLPIGDGRITTTGAQVGYVYACGGFNGMSANASGSWINGDGTYDLTEKPTVDGAVTWPSTFDISVAGDMRVFTGNGLPDHATGNYPISTSDDAYQYDRNPNSISAQQFQIQVSANPTIAASPTCLSGGPIGVMLSGVVFYNALDAGGLDAVAHEIQDDCGGHPQMNGQYHYHSFSECLDDGGTGHSSLAGYAFDGFGIYGPRGESGALLTNASLDECHGHTHLIEWNGQQVEMYHYHATYEYPYTIGCFMGTPAQQAGGQDGPPAGPRGPRP